MRAVVWIFAIAAASIIIPVFHINDSVDGNVVSWDGTEAGFQCSEGLGFDIVSVQGDTISFTVVPQEGYSFCSSSISVTVDGEPLDDVAGVYTAIVGGGSSIVIMGIPLTFGVLSEVPEGNEGVWRTWYLVPAAAVLMAAALLLLILEWRGWSDAIEGRGP